MIQGVLFDMDGILFDTEKLSIRLSTEIAQELGYTVPEDMAEHICAASHEAYQAYLENTFGPTFDFEAYDRELHHRFDVALAGGVPPMPGLYDTLEALRGMGLKLAVASSSRYNTVLYHLDDAGIRGYFTDVIGGDMVEHTKPNPAIFRRAAGALGLAPESCVAVEDSVNGIISASSAGCVTVMIPDLMQPTDELRAKTAAVLSSLTELPSFIQSLE